MPLPDLLTVCRADDWICIPARLGRDSPQQAEGITDALKEVDASALVTKTDLQEVKLDLIKWMVGTQLAYGAIIIAMLVAIL